MNHSYGRSWAEINLDHLAHNIKAIRRRVKPEAQIMAVVKADAYGHGVAHTVPVLLENGADRLAVALADEAVQLRHLGVTVPILVLSHTEPARAGELLKYDITQTVFSPDLLEALSKAALKTGKRAAIHVKLDTGMNRVGVNPEKEALDFIQLCSQKEGIHLEGVFTHFSTSDERDGEYTRWQYSRFTGFMEKLKQSGYDVKFCHAANSGAIMQYPDTALNMVRPGIILYGIYPSGEVDPGLIDLKPVMTLKSRITMIKTLNEGDTVSYGRKFRASGKTRLATLPIGYADGYSRLLSNKGRVLINGQYAPIAGNVCMDQCLVDVTGITGPVNVGDEAVLIGTQGRETLLADELAGLMGTIPYETVCAIGKRIPRVYLRNGQVEAVQNSLIP